MNEHTTQRISEMNTTETLYVNISTIGTTWPVPQSCAEKCARGAFASLGIATTTSTLTEPDSWSDDATWILTSAFIIFTMQSGNALYFGNFVTCLHF